LLRLCPARTDQGYPNVTVLPGFANGLPVGLSYIGAKFLDESLIESAYAFEQATRKRMSP
jgi:amidase